MKIETDKERYLLNKKASIASYRRNLDIMNSINRKNKTFGDNFASFVGGLSMAICLTPFAFVVLALILASGFHK